MFPIRRIAGEIGLRIEKDAILRGSPKIGFLGRCVFSVINRLFLRVITLETA